MLTAPLTSWSRFGCSC